ncbi:hypothetical protein ACFL0Y_00095 [Patescibacteria group bacterium]
MKEKPKFYEVPPPKPHLPPSPMSLITTMSRVVAEETQGKKPPSTITSYSSLTYLGMRNARDLRLRILAWKEKLGSPPDSETPPQEIL